MTKLMIHAAVASVAVLAIACNSSGDGSTAANRTPQNRATLTGCLQSGGDDGSLVLKLASAGDTTTSATAGSAPSTGDSASVRAYRVVPGKEDLAKLVDSRVAINGYIENGVSDTAVGTSGSRAQVDHSEPGAASGSPAATSGTPNEPASVHGVATSGSAAGATSGASDQGNSSGGGMQTLVADSVRKVSDRCIDGAAGNGPGSNRQSTGGGGASHHPAR